MDTPPVGTFVAPNGYDPLRHHPSDFFWFHVEPCFRPFQERDLATLDEIAPTVHTEIDPPLAQRLVAALLDEGNNNNSTSNNNSNTTTTPSANSNLQRQPLWLPGSIPCLKAFNEVFESRVRSELEDLGVLLPQDDIEEAERIRLDGWNLRHITAANSDALVCVHTETRSEVASQKVNRGEKRAYDNAEVAYLKKMIESAAKKNKSRFSKLLREMHPNHDMATGTPIPGLHANGTSTHANDSNGGGGSRDRDRDRDRDRKKKKRKSSHHDRSKSGHHNKIDASKSKKVRD